MGIQKQHGKGRRDKWYHLAKEKGYRARAAFKLLQLNKRYNFLEKSKVLIDLCAAPGSWCQVAASVMPSDSLIVGVDLAPIKPIPRCILFQSDITTDKCRATLRQHLKTWKADTVLHDGAPNVGVAWVQDAFSQAELVLQSLKLATEFLIEGGTFVTKLFRSKDYNPLLWVFQQLFDKVEATKPPSSRSVSAETFVVCRGYKAPTRLDPKFLDPRSVFAELSDPAPNNEAKVYKPELKKRKRDGYDEGDYTLYHEAPATEFIQTMDPIAMLGSKNKFSFEQKPNGDIAMATLNRLPETTDEIRTCCADLKVLGRKEFRMLLKWRLDVREIFGMSPKSKDADKAKDEEVAEVEPMDEEMRIHEELLRQKQENDTLSKRRRRKENERKQREITRMQMNMETPMEFGLEQAGPMGDDSMFALNSVKDSLNQVAKGKMHTITKAQKEAESEDDSDSDSDGDALERDLDAMYEDYQDRKAQADAKYRAKIARKEKGDDEVWEGFQEDNAEESSDEEVQADEDSSDSDDDEHDEGPSNLLTDLEDNPKEEGGLTRRAALFFDQDIFKGIDVADEVQDGDSGIDIEDDAVASRPSRKTNPASRSKSTSKSTKDARTKEGVSQKSIPKPVTSTVDESESDTEAGFEIVKEPEKTAWEEDDEPEPMKNGRPDVSIITAEAMTIAHQLASGKQTTSSLIDDGFNKYSHRDTDGLPEWFLDDENRHSKPHRPITAAAVQAIREKERALNARPIKKVAEARARKKMKAAQRIEKLKKKSALLADNEDLTEGDKAKAIGKMMSRAAKGAGKPRKKVKVVVARGGSRGLKGRPKGTKGKYKMVDSRLKKDVRAEKRLAKSKKKR